MFSFSLKFFLDKWKVFLKVLFTTVAMERMEYIINYFVSNRKYITVNVIHYTGYNRAINELSLLNECLPQIHSLAFRQGIVLPNNFLLYEINNAS
jgi:hypothetical protein